MDDYISKEYTVKNNINVLLFDAQKLGSTEYVLKMKRDSKINEFSCMDNYFKDYDCFTFGNFTPRYIAKEKVGQVISNYPVPVYAQGDEAYFYVGKVNESFIADFHINANSLAGDGTLQLIPLSELGTIVTDDNFHEITLDGSAMVTYQLKLANNRAASLLLHNPNNCVPYMMVAVCNNEKYAEYSVQFAYHGIGSYGQGGLSGGVNTSMPLISTHHRIDPNNDGFIFFYGSEDYKTPSTIDVYFIPTSDGATDISTFVLCKDRIYKYNNRTGKHEESNYCGLQFCIQNPFDYDFFGFTTGDTVQISIDDYSFNEQAVVSADINGPASLENGQYYLFCSDDNQDVSLTLMKKGANIDISILEPIVPMKTEVKINKIID